MFSYPVFLSVKLNLIHLLNSQINKHSMEKKCSQCYDGFVFGFHIKGLPRVGFCATDILIFSKTVPKVKKKNYFDTSN